MGAYARARRGNGRPPLRRRSRGDRAARTARDTHRARGFLLERSRRARLPRPARCAPGARERRDSREPRAAALRGALRACCSAAAPSATAGSRRPGRVQAATGARIFADRYAARTTRGHGVFEAERIPYFPEPAQATLAGLAHLILVEAHPPVSFFGYAGVRSTLAPEECAFHTLASPEQDGDGRARGARRGVRRTAERARGRPAIRPRCRRTNRSRRTRWAGRVAALLPEDAILSDESVSSSEALWPHLAPCRASRLPAGNGRLHRPGAAGRDRSRAGLPGPQGDRARSRRQRHVYPAGALDHGARAARRGHRDPRESPLPHPRR